MFNLDFLLINSEIELILKWSEDCVLTEKATREKRKQHKIQHKMLFLQSTDQKI